MCELRDVGELARRVLWGGGVVDMARGLLMADAAGDDAAGDCGSVFAWGISPNKQRTVSSSDGVLISTSFRSEDKNEGWSGFGGGDLIDGAEMLDVIMVLRLENAIGGGGEDGGGGDEIVTGENAEIDPRLLVEAPTAADVGAEVDGPASLGAPIRRVRGRFSLRSGSGWGSTGDPEIGRAHV